MKDFYGKTLRIGDKVAYGRPNTTRDRFGGPIIEFNKKTNSVFIDLRNVGYGFYCTTAINVVKLSTEQAILLKLKGLM